MISLLSILALGFFLGMRHATDPDHVIAVSTIVSRERQISRSALIGIFWGIGHTVTIFSVGVAIILFGFVIPPRVGLSMELAVGLMLVLLGIMNLASFFRGLPAPRSSGESGLKETGAAAPYSHVIHSHAHNHGDYVHTHAHGHAPEAHPHAPEKNPVAWLDRALLGFKLYRPIRPLMIGIVHGLAGSAAVALLVLATIRDPRWAIAYLLVFGLGTIAGMMLITISIASAFRLAHGQRLLRRLAMASGALSLAFGILVAYRIIVVNGLLAVHPQWVPR